MKSDEMSLIGCFRNVVGRYGIAGVVAFWDVEKPAGIVHVSGAFFRFAEDSVQILFVAGWLGFVVGGAERRFEAAYIEVYAMR